MKTKITFLFTALLLTLFSINANAQSNTTPIKGDVNGDGKVDVADINAVIEIMKNGGGTSGETTYYWYVGETQPTEDNYKSIATQVSFYQSEFEYTPSSREYVYCLVASNKTVQFIEPTLNAPIDILDTNVSISGYKVWKSGIKISGTIKIIISDAENPAETQYYWYAGTTEPTASNLASIKTGSTTAKPTTWTASNPQSISATNNTSSSSYIYYCFPTSWNVTVLDEDKISEVVLANVSTFTLNSVEYTVKRTGRTVSSGTTKPYYAKF